MTCTVHRLVAMMHTRVTIERAEAGACAVMRCHVLAIASVFSCERIQKYTRVCKLCSAAVLRSCIVNSHAGNKPREIEEIQLNVSYCDVFSKLRYIHSSLSSRSATTGDPVVTSSICMVSGGTPSCSAITLRCCFDG